MASATKLSVRNNSSTPSILTDCTSSYTTPTIFLSSLLLLDFLWCFSHQTPCLECTLTDPSVVQSILSLGIYTSFPPPPPLETSPNQYRVRAIQMGGTGCNRGSISLVNLLRTCRQCIQRYAAPTVLGSSFSEAAHFLDLPLIWTKYSYASPPKCLSGRSPYIPLG